MFSKRGFTLVEILVALFIFTILSLLLTGALRSVIKTQSRTEESAARLSELQMVFLRLSRDIEQAVNRPVTNASGKQDAAFAGSSRSFTFTHMGYANALNRVTHSVLQRSGYAFHDKGFWRVTWNAVDQPEKAKPHERLLLSGLAEVSFEYLDLSGHFQRDWPPRAERADVLPMAVKVIVMMANGDRVTQVYVIPAGTVRHET